MKLLDEKGKLLGLINIIDLALILVVVAVAVIGYTRLNDNAPEAEPVAEQQVRAVILYDADTEGELKALKVGDQLMADNRLQPVFIEAIKVQPKKVSVEKDGELTLKDHPYRKELLITLKGSGELDELDITLANQIVKVGRSFIVKTYTAELRGSVYEVEPLTK